MRIQGSGRTRGRFGIRLALSVTTILACGTALPAMAQAPTSTKPLLDENGVDLATGKLAATSKTIAAGNLEFSNVWAGAVDGTTFTNSIYDNGLWAVAYVEGKSIKFLNTGSAWEPEINNGAVLTTDGYGNFTYTTPDGNRYEFVPSAANSVGVGPQPQGATYSNVGRLASITYPNGETRTWNYRIEETHQNCTLNRFGMWVGPNCVLATYQRAQSVTSNRGYMLKATYSSNTAPSSGFNQLVSVQAIDLSIDYCDKLADSCTGLTQSWPTLAISENTAGSGQIDRTFTMTDDLRMRIGANGPVEGNLDSAGNLDYSITYDGSGRVYQLTLHGVTTTYTYSQSGSDLTITETKSTGVTRTYHVDVGNVRVDSKTDELGKTTTYEYDSEDRLFRTTFPEGNKTVLTYDMLGRVTETRYKPKTGSALADIVETATYTSGCTVASLIYCMSPLTKTDPRGNQTDYTYSSTHGGVTRIQFPAATSGGTRPEVNYAYTSLYAKVRNSSGTLVDADTPIWMLTGITRCATAATCSGTANETKVTITYGTGNGGYNLLPTQETLAAGDNSVSATTTYAYDAKDNLISIDGPLSGTDDTTYYFYDSENRLTGVIGPDPDGAGSLKRRATRNTYTNGALTRTESGSITGTDSSAWSSFTVAQQEDRTYDADARETKTEFASGGTTYSVIQYGYDSRGRLECTALRMNSATWTSLPSSACTLATTGSYGADRIVKYSYDNAGQITKIQTGYGTSLQADLATVTYSDNGQAATVLDAEGNKTGYAYDGFDRLSKTSYPSTTKGAGTSSSTDYEELVYDAASNVTSRRLRGYAGDSSKHIDSTYDNLNRVTAKDLPGSEPDVSYTYDLLNRMTAASQSGNALTFGFDALGRTTSQGGPLGTVGYQYDAAGRRTRTTWPDSFYVTYDYLVTGEVSAVRENGASSGVGVLATYGYDDYGRRTSLTRGNGTVTSYTFDNVSRLASIAQNLSGTAYDTTTTFGYAPSNQIATQTRTNDNYAWGGHYNVNRSHGSNGLNQLTSAGATSLGYDARGNLTSSGSSSYGYSSENLLTSAPGSVTLAYDPMLRLYQTAGGSTTKFQYDGTDMIGEYNASGTLQKRYVFGPGTDEPLVEYAGTGTSSRTFLHPDERGSVVVRSDGSGNETALNSYDEYGIPAIGNTGRFQYTGQTWLPEVGMSYYKARIYSPTLGRFMQADPAGYADSMNLYNYVSADPVNLTDPTGRNGMGGVVCTPVWVADPAPYQYLDGRGGDPNEITVTGSRKGHYEQSCTYQGGGYSYDPGANYVPIVYYSGGGGSGSGPADLAQDQRKPSQQQRKPRPDHVCPKGCPFTVRPGVTLTYTRAHSNPDGTTTFTLIDGTRFTYVPPPPSFYVPR